MKGFSKVVEVLSNYKRYQVRLKSIKIKLKFEVLDEELKSNLLEEKEEKEKVLKLIDNALDVLDQDLELPLIRAKYLNEGVKQDNLVYRSREFPYSSSHYYRIKKRALRKLDDNIGDLL
ncbi:hypothetical protein MWH28_05220 [Natroniella sulfidigena]|uniref:hypothetical protein n=1 Tax=Natroniella sulfidigena TaxID=723921 RepID=UPI00200A2BF3|nr:hypothetical protein [Natroniella sulfidigena]MCK8816771.1 hypothetical protein [Natroniella sulfidigena]